MDTIRNIFLFMNESTWMDSLMYTYGYNDVNRWNPSPESIQEVIFDLYESTWSEDLLLYQPDIEEAGLPFMTIREMRNVYIETFLNKLTEPDITRKIIEMVGWVSQVEDLRPSTWFLKQTPTKNVSQMQFIINA